MTATILQRIDSGLPLHERKWPRPMKEGQWPQAAVLVALTAEDAPRVLLGRRAWHLNNHPGEIAFAGGKRELSDVSPWETAQREAMEEVGLPADIIQPLGEFEPLITRTGFEVHPCIAGIPAEPSLVVDTGEFESVFFAPLAAFADASIYRLETMSDGKVKRKVPHYQLGDDNVWGVTAAILVMLVNVAYDAGFDLQRNWEQAP
ncbi:putative Nudix hydrolase NudL [Halioglobus japonicus]|nr:putative Nudix hydrolase NudL [Halioglobus japonicus]